jgi:hypothetical protein
MDGNWVVSVGTGIELRSGRIGIWFQVGAGDLMRNLKSSED